MRKADSSPHDLNGRRYQMKVRTIALTLAAAVAAATAVVVVLKPPAAKESPYRLRPDDAGVVAAGAKVYEAQCASCHGANLQGQPDWRSRGPDGLLPAPPHDASGHTWHHDDETLFQITKLGVAHVIGDNAYKSAMPAYADILSDPQIIAALSWIKAQWPPEARKNNDIVNSAKQ